MPSPTTLSSYLFLIAASCAGAAAAPAPTARAVVPSLVGGPASAGASAGDLDGTATPDRTVDEIAALRAQGPAALPPLLAAYDKLAPGPARDAAAATIDQVAGQRYATVSRLYWYTDLTQAQAAAAASGKPILSLRMLGQLDEDLSCANSRFFRTALYPDANVSALMRDQFVLHWSSERDIPKVTIDFGDGRRLETTVTGNSVHVVLAADGTVLDALPGLYFPAAFKAELDGALALAAKIGSQTGRERATLIRGHHEAAREAASKAWQTAAGTVAIPGRQRLATVDDVAALLALGQRAAMSKAFVEVPTLKVISAAASPGEVADDVELWAAVGQGLYGIGGLKLGPTPGLGDGSLGMPVAAPAKDRQPTPPAHVLAAPTRALMTQVHGPVGEGATADAVIDKFELLMVADTAQNQLSLRPQISAELAAHGGDLDFDEFTAWVYPTVFSMPRSDAWLGLLPRTDYSALPGDGVVTPRAPR